MWTIWVETINLTFDKNRLDVKKTKQMIWHDILEYVKIAWKEVEGGQFVWMRLGTMITCGKDKTFAIVGTTLEPKIGILERWIRT